eukprot:5126405-Pleurochrysis_carterae.AAC.1
MLTASSAVPAPLHEPWVSSFAFDCLLIVLPAFALQSMPLALAPCFSPTSFTEPPSHSAADHPRPSNASPAAAASRTPNPDPLPP